jgi:uncharacterized integral membrane protein (TIGR00697 family)
MERQYRYLVLISSLFVTSLVISNIIAVKLVTIFGLVLPAAVVLFPIAYIIGDVLTEVYGYARARQVIWIGFFCNLVAVVAIWVAGQLPSAPFWNAGAYQSAAEAQIAFDAILGFTPRLLLASFAAYLVGEFLNSFVLAKLKVKTSGRFLWLRTITSTVIGQGADSAIFISIAFAGVLPGWMMQTAILSQWLFKAAYEIAATPVTYAVVNFLKSREGIDHFDRETDFNPLRVVRYTRAE